MPETNVNDQGTPPGEGQAPGGDDRSTAEPEPETFTKEDVDKAVKTGVHKALSQAGRETKALAASKAAIEAEKADIKDREDKLTDALQRLDDAELAGASEEPDKQSILKAKQVLRKEADKLRKDKRELAEATTNLEKDKASVKEWKMSSKAEELAKKAFDGLKPETDEAKAAVKDNRAKFITNLLDLADSPEQMEKLAEALTPENAKSTVKKGKKPFVKTDTGRTGGKGQPTAQQLEDMSPEEYAAWAKERPVNPIK